MNKSKTIDVLKQRVRRLAFSLAHKDSKTGLIDQTKEAGNKVQNKFLDIAAEIGMVLATEQIFIKRPFNRDHASRQVKEAVHLAARTYSALYNGKEIVSDTNSKPKEVLPEALKEEIMQVIGELFKIR